MTVVDRRPDISTFNIIGEAVVAAQNHVFDLNDRAGAQGWVTHETGDLAFNEARNLAGVFDEACNKQAGREVTIDPAVSGMFGFDSEPYSLNAADYLDQDGRQHRIIRAGWKTRGAAGIMHTVVYFNSLPNSRSVVRPQDSSVSKTHTSFGYIRMVYDQPSGELLQAGEFVATSHRRPSAVGRQAVKSAAR